jgi:nitroreductase/FMN reductase [NAD(P)H]
MRLPPAVNRMQDIYDDSGLSAEIDGYDRRREERHPTPREKQRDAKAFGYSDSYGWSEDKARQASAAEGAAFGAMVRACGFSLD